MTATKWLLLLSTAAAHGQPGRTLLTVGVASPAQKVFRYAALRPLPAEGMALAAAGGECVSAQLVLRAGSDLPQVCVEAGDLRCSDQCIPVTDIQVLEVRYVSVPHTKEKWWPDPLPSHLRPIDLNANQNQPFWIKVSVPRYQTPGKYSGTLLLSGAGHYMYSLPLQITVLPFTLDETPPVRTAFGISAGYLAAHHKREPAFNKKAGEDRLYARYYQMLLDHGVSAYDVPFGLMSPQAVPYLRDPRVTSYVIPYTDDRAELLAMRRHLCALGVYGKGIFYPIDEPFSRVSYRTLEQRSQWVHEVAAGKVCSPFYRGPDFDNTKDLFDYAAKWLDIWCINTGYYGPKQQQEMEARRAAGGEPWWYVCCGPGKPKANFFVTMPAMRHRMLFWQMFKYHINGLLYWSTTYWNPAITKDPWDDMATVKDISPTIYGDGSLLYPGTRVGVNGPVSSQRLECIQAGLQDIQYLRMLQRACGPQAAKRMVDRLVTDMNEYSLDAGELGKVRTEIQEMLVKAR